MVACNVYMGRGIRQVKEDFTCENCGAEIVGNGFTDHCPMCLWSLHVDKTPGDRAMLEECGCLMEPARITTKGGRYAIEHHCINCGATQTTRTSPDDNEAEIQRLIFKHEGRSRR